MSLGVQVVKNSILPYPTQKFIVMYMDQSAQLLLAVIIEEVSPSAYVTGVGKFDGCS